MTWHLPELKGFALMDRRWRAWEGVSVPEKLLGSAPLSGLTLLSPVPESPQVSSIKQRLLILVSIQTGNLASDHRSLSVGGVCPLNVNFSIHSFIVVNLWVPCWDPALAHLSVL